MESLTLLPGGHAHVYSRTVTGLALLVHSSLKFLIGRGPPICLSALVCLLALYITRTAETLSK